MSSTPNDEFFEELSTLWKDQPLAYELNVEDAMKLKNKRGWLFVLDIIHGATMLLCGFYFFISFDSFLVYLSALFLIISATFVLGYSLFIHFRAIHYHDWSAMGVLNYRRLSHITNIKQLQMQQIGCFAIVVYTLFLWGYAFIGSEQELVDKLLSVYLWFCPALIAIAVFLQRKIKKVNAQLSAVNDVISDFKVSDTML